MSDRSNNNSNEVNARLRAAVHSAEVPPLLEAQVRRQIRESASSRPRKAWGTWVTAGVAAALLVGVGIAYQLGHLRQTTGDQESFIVSVSSKVATLMRVGLGDHIHCAFFRKFPQQAPAIEEMETKLGPAYKDLIPVMKQYVPADYKLALGHQCRYGGRQFVHLTMKKGAEVLSLAITLKKDGEALKIEGMLPALVQSGIPVYSSSAERFQIAAMETAGHLVYVVSPLSGKQTTELLRAMAPGLKTLLEGIEG